MGRVAWASHDCDTGKHLRDFPKFKNMLHGCSRTQQLQLLIKVGLCATIEAMPAMKDVTMALRRNANETANGTATMFPNGYPAYEMKSGDETVGVVIGIFVIVGAFVTLMACTASYCIGFRKGTYGNPKPRKKVHKKTQEELDEGTSNMFHTDHHHEEKEELNK